MNRIALPLLEDIHKYGAVLWEDLVRRHPGSTPIIEAAIRQRLLGVTRMKRTRVLSLGRKGRMHFGIQGNRPHSPATLLSQLAGRLVTHHYENRGWTFHGKFTRYGYRFHHEEHSNEYVLIKHDDYDYEYLHRIAYDHMLEALRDHAYLIYYARRITPAVRARYDSQRLMLRELEPILSTAHPKLQGLLSEVIA